MTNEFPYDIAWRSDTLTKLVVFYIGHAADQQYYYYHGRMICAMSYILVSVLVEEQREKLEGSRE